MSVYDFMSDEEMFDFKCGFRLISWFKNVIIKTLYGEYGNKIYVHTHKDKQVDYDIQKEAKSHALLSMVKSQNALQQSAKKTAWHLMHAVECNLPTYSRYFTTLPFS